MSEISELTKRLDMFIGTTGNLVAMHQEAITGCKEDRDGINKTLYDGKNGLNVRVRGLETSIKGKQSFFGSTLSMLTALFMGGIFIMWIIKMIVNIPK